MGIGVTHSRLQVLLGVSARTLGPGGGECGRGGHSPWPRSGAGLHVLEAHRALQVSCRSGVTRWPLASFLQGATRCWSAWCAGPCSTASTSRAPCTASPSPLTAGKGPGSGPALSRAGAGWGRPGGLFHSGRPRGSLCRCLVLAAQTILEPSDPAGSWLLRGCHVAPLLRLLRAGGHTASRPWAVKEPPALKS